MTKQRSKAHEPSYYGPASRPEVQYCTHLSDISRACYNGGPYTCCGGNSRRVYNAGSTMDSREFSRMPDERRNTASSVACHAAIVFSAKMRIWSMCKNSRAIALCLHGGALHSCVVSVKRQVSDGPMIEPVENWAFELCSQER